MAADFGGAFAATAVGEVPPVEHVESIFVHNNALEREVGVDPTGGRAGSGRAASLVAGVAVEDKEEEAGEGEAGGGGGDDGFDDVAAVAVGVGFGRWGGVGGGEGGGGRRGLVGEGRGGERGEEGLEVGLC